MQICYTTRNKFNYATIFLTSFTIFNTHVTIRSAFLEKGDCWARGTRIWDTIITLFWCNWDKCNVWFFITYLYSRYIKLKLNTWWNVAIKYKKEILRKCITVTLQEHLFVLFCDMKANNSTIWCTLGVIENF